MKLYREIKLLTEDGEVTDVILTDQVYTEDHIKAMLKNRSVCDGGASRVSLNGMVWTLSHPASHRRRSRRSHHKNIPLKKRNGGKVNGLHN